MKIALLHLDLAGGPRDKNESLLLHASKRAAEKGASIIVTPETALEGYYFYMRDPVALERMPVHRSSDFRHFQNLAKEKNLTIFLSAVEKEKNGRAYNSCFFLAPDGEEKGAHRKMYSHRMGAEAWLSVGSSIHIFPVTPLRVGVLVCSDVYYEKSCRAMKEAMADLVIVSAAWPPASCCPDPLAVWEKSSLRCGCPIVLCNQTGHYKRMDMTRGDSAVLSEGKCLMSYRGDPAVLLFDYDEVKRKVRSQTFEVLPC